jgi:hypothetical protein
MSKPKIFNSVGNQFADIIDKVTVEVTISGVDYVYEFFADVGTSRATSEWAVRRTHTVGNDTIIRWARRSDMAGAAAYFAFSPNSYLGANDYMGD